MPTGEPGQIDGAYGESVTPSGQHVRISEVTRRVTAHTCWADDNPLAGRTDEGRMPEVRPGSQITSKSRSSVDTPTPGDALTLGLTSASEG